MINDLDNAISSNVLKCADDIKVYRDGLWTLEERRNRADLLEIFKLIKVLAAVSWSHFFIQYDNRTTI